MAHYNNWVSKAESVHGIRPWIRMVAQHNYFATNGKSRSTNFSFDTNEQKPFNNPKSIGINVGNNINNLVPESPVSFIETIAYDGSADTVEEFADFLSDALIETN